MERDPFDYDELSRNVEDLLNDEYGARTDDFDLRLDDAMLPPDPGSYRNAANGYGGRDYDDRSPDFDEEAAAMRYDPQTNTGAAIRAYNTDYATRAAKRAKHNPPPKPQRRSDAPDATRKLPRSGSYDRQEVLDRIERRPRSNPRPAPRPAAIQEEPKVKKKKKHGFLKFLLWLVLLLALAMIALWVFARQPEGDSLGERREGCSAVLLAGTDADGVRTDTMMLLFLDKNAGQMNLLSLPRDTYTSMDIEVPKLNAVYSVAGQGKEGMERLMEYGSDVHLNGNQALAYARLRYVGNSDWERTERQRRVIKEVITKSKNMSLLQIDSLLNDVLPNVHTDMTDGEIASILLDVFDYLEYDVQEVRIPADGYYSNEIRANMDVLLFNANANAAIIQKVVYGDCSTVEEAIAEYQEETGDYYAYTYMY